MTTTFNEATQPTSILSEDMRKITGERKLVELALQASELFGASLTPSFGAPGQDISSRMLLTLLTYSYTAGIYASEEIGRACRSDAGARYICANDFPETTMLRSFRRRWRPLILSCLQWVHANVQGAHQTHPITAEALHISDSDDAIRISERKLNFAILLDTADCD